MRHRLRRGEHGGERLRPRRDAIIGMMTVGAGVDALGAGLDAWAQAARAHCRRRDALLSFSDDRANLCLRDALVLAAGGGVSCAWTGHCTSATSSLGTTSGSNAAASGIGSALSSGATLATDCAAACGQRGWA